MTEKNYQIGQVLQVQFVWRIPDGDRIRAVFDAVVERIDQLSEKYVVQLGTWRAGRQESAVGQMRSLEEVSRDQWALVARLPGQRISLSFEASDGRPLWLRYETLTGEHNFFSRLNKLAPAVQLKLSDIPYQRARTNSADPDEEE